MVRNYVVLQIRQSRGIAKPFRHVRDGLEFKLTRREAKLGTIF
jgi:hypothetical protein